MFHLSINNRQYSEHFLEVLELRIYDDLLLIINVYFQSWESFVGVG